MAGRPRVIVAGFLADGLGLGQAARSYARALAHGGCDVHLHVLAQPGREIGLGCSGAGELDLPHVGPDADADVLVVCANPVELARWQETGTPLPAGRATVGVWAYEVDPVPRAWREHVGRFDELWVNTKFIANLVEPAVDVPVVAVPPPALLCPPAPCDLSTGAPPTFLTLCDVASTLARKNPGGAIDAFRQAFAPGEGPRLLVKVWNGHVDPEGLDELHSSATRDDIVIAHRWLPRPELVGLVADSLALVSLHRAEGFGFPIVEALALGVPAVCTDTTGVAEQLDDGCAFLVRSRSVAVGPGAAPYPPEGRWREPDVDHAAEQLRLVWEDGEERARRAAAGQRVVDEQFEVDRIGSRLRARVDALVAPAARRGSARSPLRPAVSVVVHAAEPWPALRPFLDTVVPQLAEVDAELLIGASGPDVLPEGVRPPRVRVVPGRSRSPFDLRAAALAEADGDLVVVTEDHVEPGPSWLAELVEAHRTSGAALLAGPVANGSGDTRADWANYLITFAAYAPPLVELPADRSPTISNLAVDGSRLRAAIGAPEPRPGQLERDLVAEWWAGGEARVVPGAVVHHTQPHPGWRHVMAHFHDARTAGAYQRERGSWSAFAPRSLRATGRAFLRGTAAAVAVRPDLVRPHREASWWLRALAAARALGLAWGARWGEGRSALRLR
ncbi:MAG TPA: glycosyltransferase [Acidimicrobiia bacterium]|nr:glycosyltransferase [Acidimicrobiia bacterium]